MPKTPTRRPAKTGTTPTQTPAAPPVWPDGFTPRDSYGETAPADLAAYLDALAPAIPAETWAPLPEAAKLPDAGRFDYVLARADDDAGARAADHAGARAAFGRALGSAPFLDFLDAAGEFVPTWSKRRPVATLRPAGSGAARWPLSAFARDGETVYVCELTGRPFALSSAASVPALGFEYVVATGVVEESGFVEGEPHGTLTVHPSLMKAGPAVLAQALAYAADRALDKAAFAASTAGDLLTLSAGVTAAGIGAAWPGVGLESPEPKAGPAAPLPGVRTLVGYDVR